MGFIDKLEQGLEKAVRGTFGKGGTFEPVDIANRLRTEMDNKAYAVSNGRTLAPNVFTVEFSAADFSRAQEWGVPLAEELCDVVIRHARDQGYSLRGSVRVTFTLNDLLDPDEFEVIGAQQQVASPQEDMAPQYAPPAPPVPEYVPVREPAPPRRSMPAAPPPTEPVPAYNLPQPRRTPKPQVVLEVNGERIALKALPVTLGRGSNADITVEDTGVSRRHLEIVQQDDIYLAVDLGSTNGSYVNGRRLNGRIEIKNGAVIEIGRARIIFRLMVRKG